MASVENVVASLGGNNNASSDVLPAYSNSGANRVVVMDIAMCVAGATPASVSSITGGGLTWARRSVVTLTDNDGSDHSSSLERWWAFASAQVSSQVFTVNYTGSPKTHAIAMLSVAGAFTPSSPWDTDASLPKTGTHAGASSNPTVSGVAVDDLVPVFLSASTTRNGDFSQVPPSGYTTVGPSHQEPAAGNDRSYMVGGYLVSTGPQSGITLTGGASETVWLMAADAIAGDDVPPPLPPRSYGQVIS